MSRATDDALETLIAPTASAMGYSLVRVRLTGSHPPRLQVMAERADGAGMTVDDCAGLSTAISALLDVEDPIAGRYELEVGSPGIDRPLVRLDDFKRFAGREAKVETNAPVDGRKRFRGRLAGTDGDGIVLDLDAGRGRIVLPFAAVEEAKLVLTDELIRAAMKTRAGD
ncbi:MAG TPA: ribosome maturation factor RimP [Alphaproteobacteria bacterium]